MPAHPFHLSRRSALVALPAAFFFSRTGRTQAPSTRLQSWPRNTPRTTGIHDLAPAPGGGVWFSAQRSGHLGWFDPGTGKSELIALGNGSSPHGVIAGPDGAAWLTDGGQNAIVRVSWPAREVKLFPLPAGTPNTNLNTCAFDGDGDLWFTGQNGYVGKVAARSGVVSVKESPRGRGPYGICATPQGDIWWCSLAGSFIAQIDRKTGNSRIVEPPTPRQGARRVWSDSRGRIWVSEWNSGNLSVHDPALGTGANSWRTWKAPGADPHVYAVYVDDKDMVWASEWSHNVMLRFDPRTEKFDVLPLPRPAASIRQILGRSGEVWLPESGTEFISVIRTG
ncbi:lyase [Polaromonas sp. SM01]|uniref:Vgb family protein n=1 Tax=Polaromonas sp. SM01 TaxID=3085630 RepID=UPI002981172F|nr:lyase [Polaromonas sp. SM01]MDW5444838.1 lyase [Polaromonas sp. SM01]